MTASKDAISSGFVQGALQRTVIVRAGVKVTVVLRSFQMELRIWCCADRLTL